VCNRHGVKLFVDVLGQKIKVDRENDVTSHSKPTTVSNLLISRLKHHLHFVGQ